MSLTHEEFNTEVGAFVADVERAVNCFPTQLWTIEADLASPDSDRLRSVVDAKLDLLGPHDDSKQGLAELAANYKLCVDSYGTHIAVENSSFVLKAKLDRAPIIRWDYDRDARTKSRSHVQVTAHRGALSHILSRLEHKTPHSIESLHIPMGGERVPPVLGGCDRIPHPRLRLSGIAGLGERHSRRARTMATHSNSSSRA